MKEIDFEVLYKKEITNDRPIKYISYSNQKEIEKYSIEYREAIVNKKAFNKEPPKDDESIEIYPVKVDDYDSFYTCIGCLLLDRSNTKDSKVLSMSYLNYLLYLIGLNDGNSMTYTFMLVELFKLAKIVTQEDLVNKKFSYGKDKKGSAFLNINDVVYSKKDFDNIRKIICIQNGIKLPDKNVDPKLKKALEDVIKFKNRKAKPIGTLEDRMICISISTSYKLDEINQMTIRKFDKFLQRIDHKLHYEIYRAAEMNGTTFKSTIDSWMADLTVTEEDLIRNLTVDFDGFSDKLSNKR